MASTCSPLVTPQWTGRCSRGHAFALKAAGYMFFYLMASVLEERVATTSYRSYRQDDGPSVIFFRFPVVLNAIQFFSRTAISSLYLWRSAKSRDEWPMSKATLLALPPIAFITIANNFCSKLEAASLAYMDYTTLLVARSCMLVPVVSLNVLILQKRYAWYRYILFLAATIGLILFSLPEYGINHLQNDKTRITRHWAIGSMLLWANIFIDASTYIILEHIVSHPAQYGQLKGASRMLLQNGISMILTFGYLILAQLLPTSTGVSQETIMELSNMVKFVRNSPEVLYDVIGFALCGSLAQVLLFTAFREFSSLLQTQIRIARKTLSTVFSITWFKRTLTPKQFFGVVLVFGAISLEGLVHNEEQKAKKEKQS